ncbi:acyl-CoA dehydrogenase family protein [Polyangium aurulentum]|uniref:acyl-CoA dehydrogenase family protein n=1 Tax=Polyangium aurulentum TaxID=2567896 RepID=UPI00146C7536|nr:acyl-CoA dehydrogenase family protein [Polyangium aurulentum]UQA59465.1 acyl-CoA dehydrogenase family protein [Polyangium aurulentum]
MANFFTDNEDLRFYFEEGIDWDPLVEVTEYGYRTADGFKSAREAVGFYRDVAEMVGELSAEQIATRAADIDREGTRLDGGEAKDGPAMTAVFEALKAAELHRLCLPRELGGLNAPLLLYFLAGEMIARADVSVMTHHSFHGGMAMAALAYSVHEGTTDIDAVRAHVSKTRFSSAIEEMARGDAWGSMDITEPNAGSDMAALRTRAEQDENGRWYLTGQKIFITSGHGKYHFVIARTEDAKDPNDPFAGLGGLSMFLAKAYEDGPNGERRRFVTIDRVEEKLGHHGSVTAALSFDRTPAELVGKRGEGFKYMLVLMNNARVGVGFESIGLAENAYRMARAYAEERRSMGKTIAQHEMIADYLDEMRTDIQALRALAVEAAYHEEASQKLALLGRFAGLAATGREKERMEKELPMHRARSRRLTPLLKYLAAEKAVEIARRNVQIHGGVGYTKDYGAEKLLRDAMVLPIYEGTSQIQALMAMKDTLVGAIRRPHEFVSRLAQARLRAMSSRDPLERRVARIQSFSLSAQQFLLTRTAAGKLKSLADVPVSGWRDALTKGWDPKRDFSLAMLHAERLMKLLADEAIGEILLAQASAHPKRRELLVRWLDRAELRARALHEEITTTGGRILAMLAPEQEALAAE